MGTAIGDILPLALGVAISPIPIIAAILMLLTPNAGGTATSFTAGWVLGIAGGYAVLVVIASVVGLSTGSGGNPTAATIKIVLGVLLLLLAAKQWKSRPAPGATPEMPAWLAAIDKVTPGKAFGLGVLLSVVNPKNLLMIVGAAVAVAQLGVSGVTLTVAGVVFTVIAASTVAVPVIAYFAARDSVTGWLNNLKAWLTANNAAVMATLLLVIGVVMIGKGLATY
ncbi:GAP family protein [Rhodococcus olei]|uniref:GAP family protein n=1 Tax=Rhodococcus olei TaxID=2161675 RepID=A0ABP8NWM1_9NOCA